MNPITAPVVATETRNPCLPPVREFVPESNQESIQRLEDSKAWYAYRGSSMVRPGARGRRR